MSSPTVLPFVRDASDNLAYTIVYSGDEVDYIEVAAEGVTYRRTFTYTAGKVTAVTAWVRQ